MRKVVVVRKKGPLVSDQKPPSRQEATQSTLLSPDTYLEIFGRITKIITRAKYKGAETIFQVLTPNTGYLITCASAYFSPVMTGDAIFLRGFVDETGNRVEASKPPFISPGNDPDSILQACIIAVGNREKVNLILAEVRRLLYPEEELSNRLDLLSVSFNRIGAKLLAPLFQETLVQEATKLLIWWYKKRCLRRLYLLDFTNTEINASGFDPVELFQVALTNPYRIGSISLEKAESILIRLNSTLPPEAKYCGEIMRRVATFLNRKWTYVPRDFFEKLYPDLPTYAKSLQKDYGITVSKEYVALTNILKIEEEVASFFKHCMTQPKQPLSHEDISLLGEIMEQYNCDLDQSAAIQGILKNNVVVINGEAGTGKTTILRALVAYLSAKGLGYVLTSFTGKAVARIREVIPESYPMTLHRLLGTEIESSKFHYLIIDETSMLETALLARFIQRYKYTGDVTYNYKVILIGDDNQLRPIGWGCFFNELVKTKKIPTYTLTQCHRIEGIGILTNAKLLLEGCFFDPTVDFHLAWGKTPLDIIKQHHLSAEKVRVLAPFIETVNEQNTILQEYFTSGNPFIEDTKGRKWYLQDRVMMTKNNKTIDVANGQEGFIPYFDPNEEGINVAFNEGNVHLFTFRSDDTDRILAFYPPSTGRFLDVDTCDEVTVNIGRNKKFWNEQYRICGDHRVLFYNLLRELENNDEDKRGEDDNRQFPPVDHLILSYALTIHKAQGSEWDYVIILLPKRARNSDFITRNLLYTAITRARKGVYCLGDEKAWLLGILNLEKEPKQLLGTYLCN